MPKTPNHHSNIKLAGANAGKAILANDTTNKEITVTPIKDFNGDIKITYDVTDTEGAVLKTDYILTVTNVNDAPIARNDTIWGIDTTQTYTLALADLLKNDYDIDGDSLTVASITDIHVVASDAAKVKNFNVDYSAGTVAIDFANNATNMTLTYKIKDGKGGYDTANVMIGSSAPLSFDTSRLDGNNGFSINGLNDGDNLGYSASLAGDYNGDGYDDFIIGAPNVSRFLRGHNQVTGEAYLIFGKADDYPANFDLSDLNGKNGFKIFWDYSGNLGQYLSSAGDMNGDGIDDFAVGNRIVFGKNTGFTNELNVSTSSLDGVNGFHIDIHGKDYDTAGDVNNDGYDDFIMAYPLEDIDIDGDGTPDRDVGRGYIVFGRKDGYSASMSLSDLKAANQVITIDGLLARYSLGYNVSSLGDIDGDGFDDVSISGAANIDVNGDGTEESNISTNFIIFGKNLNPLSFDLTSLNGSNGFRIHDGTTTQGIWNTSSVGDINGDGFDDILINRSNKGYVIFGKNSGFTKDIDLSSLDASNGFMIDNHISSVSHGDINGDGFDDIVIGDHMANPYNPPFITKGGAYVIYGKETGFGAFMDISSVNGNNGFFISTNLYEEAGSVVSSNGDINGDGFDDVIINSRNKTYTVFGYDNKNSQSVTHNGDSDDEVISGSAVNDTLNGAGGKDVIHGGNGDDKINGGTGDDKLDGGYGNDQFIFNNGFDSDIILDFEDGKDKINLSSYTKSDNSKIKFDDLTITKSGGDVIITSTDFYSGDQILIRNISDSNITADDFIF